MPGLAESQRVLELRPGDGIDQETANRFPLVAFNLSGTRLPLVCVRTWRNDVDTYRNLASALGPDQPICTASPPMGKAEADFPRDTEAWAEHFSRILGPILDRENLILGGWSYAGVIALYMADQLAARGRRPLLVNLFDSIMPVAKPRGDSRKRTHLHKFVVRLNQGMEIADLESRRKFFVDHAKNHATKIVRRRLLNLENAGRRLVGRETKADPGLVKKQLKATAPIDPNMQAIRVGYLKSRPTNSTLPVALYWTEESQTTLGDSSLGWCMRALGEFHSYPIKGDHQSLFFPENIGPLANALSGELERAGKRASVDAPRKVARQSRPDGAHLQSSSHP